MQHPYPAAAYGPAGYGAPAYAPSGPTTTDGVPLAGWWWRFLAVVLDGIFLSILTILPTLPFVLRMVAILRDLFRAVVEAAQSGSPPPPTPTTLLDTPDQIAYTAIALGVAAAYNIGFLRFRGATPGKLILRLRVVPVDQGHSAPGLSWHTAGVRTAVWLVPSTNGFFVTVLAGLGTLISLFWLLDALFPLWQPKRQAVHDLAAKTQVVKIS